MDAPPGVIRSQTDTSSYAVRQTRPLSERSRAPVTHGAALGSPRGTYLETLRTDRQTEVSRRRPFSISCWGLSRNIFCLTPFFGSDSSRQDQFHWARGSRWGPLTSSRTSSRISSRAECTLNRIIPSSNTTCSRQLLRGRSGGRSGGRS